MYEEREEFEEHLMTSIDLHSIFFHTIEVNGYHQLFGYQHSSNVFVSVYQKKGTHTGLEEFPFLSELSL